MNGCLFCNIIEGSIPAKKLYEDDEVLAFWDIAPQAPKHFLVIPKKHISGPSDMTEDDDKLMGKLVRIGSKLAEENDLDGNFRVVINNGAEAGQVVFHIHLHFLGGRKMNWPPG